MLYIYNLNIIFVLFRSMNWTTSLLLHIVSVSVQLFFILIYFNLLRISVLRILLQRMKEEKFKFCVELICYFNFIESFENSLKIETDNEYQKGKIPEKRRASFFPRK